MVWDVRRASFLIFVPLVAVALSAVAVAQTPSNSGTLPKTRPADSTESKDLLDSKGNYTNRAIAIATIASAQVAEMRCGQTGWIAAAVHKFDKLGLHVDVNDKEDFSAILYFATNILQKVEKVGAQKWCKDVLPQIAEIIKGQ